MLSAIRKNQHSLTLIIVCLTIISFIWLYNRTNLSQVGTNDVASIYGKVLQRADIESEVRDYRLAMALGLTDFIRDMGGFADNEEVAMSSFIFNDLVLQHEATALHVVPTEKAVVRAIESLSAFQMEGAFDSTKYALYMKEELIPRGFTEQQLERVVSDSLCLKKVRELIVSPVAISQGQLQEAARVYQPVKAQALFFDRAHYLTNQKKNEITTEEKKSFYEKNQKSFLSDEQRAAHYIIATLSPEEQKLEVKERVRAMQQLSDRLAALKQKAQDAHGDAAAFEKAATENGFGVITTHDFNKQGEVVSSSGEQKIPQEIVEAAFKLSNAGDVSEVIQNGSSFYLVTLAKETPSRELAFSEVEGKIERLLQEQKAFQEMNEVATKSVQKIREAMSAGKTFTEAVTLAECKPEALPAAMSPEKVAASPGLSSQQKEAIMATLPLQPGDLGELKQTSWGDFVVYLQERAPLSNADWEAHRGQLEENFLQQEREVLFFDWMRKARLNADITMLDGRHRRSLLQRIFGK